MVKSIKVNDEDHKDLSLLKIKTGSRTMAELIHRLISQFDTRR